VRRPFQTADDPLRQHGPGTVVGHAGNDQGGESIRRFEVSNYS
jgi:hypothetical protein